MVLGLDAEAVVEVLPEWNAADVGARVCRGEGNGEQRIAAEDGFLRRGVELQELKIDGR